MIRYIPAQLKMAVKAEDAGDHKLADTHLGLALHAEGIFNADFVMENAAKFEREGNLVSAEAGLVHALAILTQSAHRP